MENYSFATKKYALLLISFLTAFVSCQKPIDSKKSEETFRVGAWMGANSKTSTAELENTFSKLEQAGFHEVLINTGGNSELLKKITPLAKSYDLDVHAWMFTMNRPGDTLSLKHPDWYTVSRDGKSCYDTRPYVNYYQWLCPSREDAVNHVLSLVRQLAEVPEIKSVHLDYIRFVDVFLPIGLLPKYDLIQNTELPEYDFCYCEVCRAKFKAQHHRDPLDLEHPELDVEWRQFRLNAIRNVVNQAYEIAHQNKKELTSAVFPYPTMAANMVRQRWDKWNVDRVYPMLYHNFYKEPLEWIGFATQQGVNDLKAKQTVLSSGVYVPAIEPSEIPKLIHMVKTSGANGITFFDAKALSDAHLEIIKEVLFSLPKEKK